MAFQFLCPNGHLLQGDESQAGQQCKCPYCGGMFIVPNPPSAPPAGGAPAPQRPAYSPQPGQQPAVYPGQQLQPYTQPQTYPQPGYPPPSYQPPAPDLGYPPPGVEPQPYGPPTEEPYEEPEPTEPPEDFPGIRTGKGDESLEVDRETLPGAEQHADILHILCPRGHELETPREMLGQDAMCPYCETVFRLRLEDSVEHRKQKEEKRERRELKQSKAWLNWAIAAAVLVVLGLITLIVMASKYASE